MIALDPQRLKFVRQRGSQISATLVLPSEDVRPDTIRHLWREYVVHDPDTGEPTRQRRHDKVNDVVNGELRQARLTIKLVELVTVYDEEPSGNCRILTQTAALACGFRTTTEAREWWREAHPVSLLAQLIWFTMGDTRDKDLFLRRMVSRGGDYTTARADDLIDHLPALTPEQLEELAAHNHQRHTAQQAQTASTLAEETLAQRAGRLEAIQKRLPKEIDNELDIIRERTNRGLRKLRNQP